MFLTLIIILFILLFLYFYKHFELKQHQSLDYYANFNDLKQHTTKNKDWKIIAKRRKHSDTLITAIHGGSIEPGTTELARRISNIGQYNFYSFEGL
ncbi:poly-gamma-glutamate hydrolase family protein, partial [Staphylococcus hominis]|nr:poly-gamma-glutamate hydrolase family protein [Staphylococcus hominis]